MPLYEYQCDNCGERFEAMQKFADAPLTLHEKCGGPARRLLSVPALQFKGSGFYINDYAKSGSGSSGNGESKNESKKKSESGESSSGKEGSSTKTESTTSSTKSSDTPAPATTSKPVSDKK
jgi:putative FmdB family regulatory protein